MKQDNCKIILSINTDRLFLKIPLIQKKYSKLINRIWTPFAVIEIIALSKIKKPVLTYE